MDGDRAGASRILRSLRATTSPDAEVVFNSATWTAYAGDLDAALDLLSRAANTGFISYQVFDVDRRPHAPAEKSKQAPIPEFVLPAAVRVLACPDERHVGVAPNRMVDPAPRARNR